MLQNFYSTQKIAEAHRDELMSEAEHQRLVADLPGERNGIAAKLGMFFTILGTSLKRLGRLAARRQMPIGAPLTLGSPHH